VSLALIMTAKPVAEGTRVSHSQDGVIVDEALPLVLDTARSILGQSVQPSDNFFDLGGDSMQAVEMMHTLEDLFDVEFDPTIIIDAEDMAALAASLHDQLQES
jgi:acyl carrier protein